MFKITPLIIGLLAVISIAPKSQAMTANNNSLAKPARDLHAQVFVRVGERPEFRHHQRSEHYRQERQERQQRHHRSYRDHQPRFEQSREHHNEHRGERHHEHDRDR
jgi:hypothetical protein